MPVTKQGQEDMDRRYGLYLQGQDISETHIAIPKERLNRLIDRIESDYESYISGREPAKRVKLHRDDLARPGQEVSDEEFLIQRARRKHARKQHS